MIRLAGDVARGPKPTVPGRIRRGNGRRKRPLGERRLKRRFSQSETGKALDLIGLRFEDDCCRFDEVSKRRSPDLRHRWQSAAETLEGLAVAANDLAHGVASGTRAGGGLRGGGATLATGSCLRRSVRGQLRFGGHTYQAYPGLPLASRPSGGRPAPSPMKEKTMSSPLQLDAPPVGVARPRRSPATCRAARPATKDFATRPTRRALKRSSPSCARPATEHTATVCAA